MPARAATPLDAPRISGLLERSLRSSDAVLASALPAPFAAGAMTGFGRLTLGLMGVMGGRMRVFLEEYRGQLRSAALVYDGRRPEWVIVVLCALHEPGGADSAFRLLSGISAAAARAGMHRLFAAVPDETRARETFFQAGFYSYTRETWLVATRAQLDPPRREGIRAAHGSDAHDLFRFYVATTPHAVQRAEQLSVQDFDVSRRGGAYDPPHLVGGNPLAMHREAAFVVGDERSTRAFAFAYSGRDRHPHVCKVRTRDGDVDLARDLIRTAVRALPPGRPITAPVRSYEEHLGRALLAEGFRETATAMLFTKELAVRIEEPALAPVAAR
ncbi:MAG TPA: hypothetical protein VFC31_09545 [Candidatus Limnocylindria bacterium]|nr:hypothetical protein [Candidatus Limnocylindria bacterium]